MRATGPGGGREPPAAMLASPAAPLRRISFLEPESA
jgi:hypothetical protein